MQENQHYTLTIRDLFALHGNVICGADAEVAILDGCAEIDRVKFSGKVQCESGYSRSYQGMPGLTAVVASGPGSVTLTQC